MYVKIKVHNIVSLSLCPYGVSSARLWLVNESVIAMPHTNHNTIIKSNYLLEKMFDARLSTCTMHLRGRHTRLRSSE